MRRPKKVVLLIETSNGYARGLLEGIEQYIRDHEPWHVFLAERGRGDPAPEWLSSWDGDGIIARVDNVQIAEALIATGIPGVNVSGNQLMPDWPTITTNNLRVAEMAFEHFRVRGFEHFAYCGLDQFPWSVERGQHFEDIVTSHGFSMNHYRQNGKTGDKEIDAVGEWLSTLPKPVAVLTCYDSRGQNVLDAAHRVGINVPEDVIVLGVDNDELLCSLSPPPLSSIHPNQQYSGRLAAAFLEKLMNGEEVENKTHLTEPNGVVSRLSTDILAVHDECVAQGMKFIRENAHLGISVNDIVNELKVSRRTFEMRMKKAIGRSPHSEITRLQVNRAKELLMHTNLPISIVAERSGFTNMEYFSNVFRKAAKISPSKFRKYMENKGETTSA